MQMGVCGLLNSLLPGLGIQAPGMWGFWVPLLPEGFLRNTKHVDKVPVPRPLNQARKPSFFFFFFFRIMHYSYFVGSSLAVQWLRPRALTAEGPSSIPGQETKIPQAA